MKPLRILWKVVQKLLIAVVSLLLLVVVGELVTRANEPGPFSFMDENPYVKPFKGLRQFHKPNFEGRWDGTWYGTNSMGLRGPEIEVAKEENELRIVALGDSCTFGKSVEEADTWPRQVETLLRGEITDGRTVNVANCGVNGFAGKDYIKMFKVIGGRLDPDIVVVGYNLNDFPNVLKKIDQVTTKQAAPRQVLKKAVGGKQNLDRLNESALYRFARAFYYDQTRAKAWEDAERFAKETSEDKDIKSLKHGAFKVKDPETAEALAAQVAQLKADVEAVGAKLALFLFPYESQVYLEKYDRTPIEKMREICGELDIPFVDLAEEFRKEAQKTDPPREMFVYGDRYHPRPVGYRIVAENVVGILRERGWLTED